MKIKLTETQAKRFKLLENTDPLSQFEHLCRIKLQEVNKIYTNVINISVSDIINNDVNIEGINDLLNAIEHDIRLGNIKAYNHINNLPDTGLDARIDSADDTVFDKLNSLQMVVMDLEKLQGDIRKYKLNNRFSDIKPIDISSIQH